MDTILTITTDDGSTLTILDGGLDLGLDTYTTGSTWED